ncbi:MAG: radical SAM protein, partial [Candidatus Eremiobacterota bacterium]
KNFRTEIITLTIKQFSVQWHITTKCGNRCKHCYMFDSSTYEQEKSHELDRDSLFKILDSISAFEKKWKANINTFDITGGDPLLRDDWKMLLEELAKRKKIFHMMGNAESLTDENLEFMKHTGLKGFQLSLDGLPDTHDYLRGKGSFQRTVQGIKKLKDYDIPVSVMFTLSPENKDELIPLMEFLAKETPATGFSFDIVSSVGNAKDFEKTLNRDIIRKILKDYIEKKRELHRNGYKFRCSEKLHLFRLTHFELSEYYPVSSSECSIIGGCSIGWSITILSDGTVLPCRRFPLKIGKMPEQSFEEILLGSRELKKFRRPEFYEECGECDFFQLCRGCPAVVYGLTGHPFSPYPLCFRKYIDGKKAEKCVLKKIPLEISYEEEYELICNHFLQKSDVLYRDFLNKYAGLIVNLCWNSERFNLFMKDREEFLLKEEIEMNDMEKILLNNFLLRRAQGNISDGIIKKLFEQVF